MGDNGKRRPIRAGQAFMAAVNADPRAQESLVDALERLRSFAEAVRTVGVSQREASEVLRLVFSAIEDITSGAAAEQQRMIKESLSKLRADQERLFAELAGEVKSSADSVDEELASFGFEPPANDLSVWEELARIAEKEPGPMTMEEIYLWAIAWAKRELLRRKMDAKAAQISGGNDKSRHPSVRSAEEASIFRDEHDRKIAWCVGKRIYLGEDTQISRLFWLLASPLGRVCSLGEVQRAVNHEESSREMNISEEQIRKANQSVRKAISKLRARLIEADADDHLFINRGGSQKHPEYTMVLRFG